MQDFTLGKLLSWMDKFACESLWILRILYAIWQFSDINDLNALHTKNSINEQCLDLSDYIPGVHNNGKVPYYFKAAVGFFGF